MSVRFEWDEAKRKLNLRKHGVDFADLPPLFDGVTVTVLDDRFEYGEDRFLTLGVLQGIGLRRGSHRDGRGNSIHIGTQGNTR